MTIFHRPALSDASGESVVLSAIGNMKSWGPEVGGATLSRMGWVHSMNFCENYHTVYLSLPQGKVPP